MTLEEIIAAVSEHTGKVTVSQHEWGTSIHLTNPSKICLDCKRRLRARGVRKSEDPDSVTRATETLCGSCYKIRRGYDNRGERGPHVRSEDRLDDITHALLGNPLWESIPERVGLKNWGALLKWCNKHKQPELSAKLRSLREHQGGYEVRGRKKSEFGEDDDWLAY